MNIKAREYIVKELNRLSEKFMGIQIRYEFNVGLNREFIEVLPLEIYDAKAYLLDEQRITDTFEELFGDKEEILFISEGSLNYMEKEHKVTSKTNAFIRQ